MKTTCKTRSHNGFPSSTSVKKCPAGNVVCFDTNNGMTDFIFFMRSSQCVLPGGGLVVRWFLNGLANRRMMFLLAVKTGELALTLGGMVSGINTIET